MSDTDPRSSKDLIDRSKLLKGRARRRIAGARERIDRGQHRWEHIALGRVCSVCRTTQTPNEYDDDVDCVPKAS